MKYGLLYGFALLICTVASCDVSGRHAGETGVDSLAAALEASRIEQGIAGIVVVTLDSGRVTGEHALGFRSVGEAMTPATVFEAASLSKTVFAVIVHRLARGGRLDLDEPLSRWPEATSIVNAGDPAGAESCAGAPFEQLNLPEPWLDTVTARGLLAHYAGLSDEDTLGSGSAWRGRVGNFAYTELGVLLLQGLVECRMQRSLDRLAAELFTDAGMTESSFVWNRELAAASADGFAADGTVARGMKRSGSALANGTLLTTGPDFARFMLWLHSQPNLVAAVAAPQVEVSGAHPTLRWGTGVGVERVDSATYIWQWGTNWWFRSFFALDIDSGRGFVAFSNDIEGYRLFEQVATDALGVELAGLRYAKWHG